MSSAPDVAFEIPCPRCKVLRLALREFTPARRRAAISFARTFQPHPSHVTSGPGPYFVTGVLCESIVLGAGRVIQGDKA